VYQDQILFAIGIGAAVLFALLLVYLVVSHKRGQLFRRIVEQETVPFDALSSTMQMTQPTAEMKTTEESVHTILTEVEYADNNFATTVLTDDVHSSDLIARTNTTSTVTLKPVSDFDASVLKGHYTLRGELEGGGMGRIFLARKDNVGNDWIVKYVPQSIGELTNEADILKSLNHISLPQIIDVFNDENGLYIVESYIAGVSLKHVLKPSKIDTGVRSVAIPEFQLLDWAEQLAQVISYLHTREQPVFHFDLKPSNIMVTYSNKLVLIDFGISRRQSEVSEARGATYSYAAPEQLKTLPRDEKRKKFLESRFGALPEERKGWSLDGRTDIYSLGVVLFEIAVGEPPRIDNRTLLKKHLSRGMCDIINKCLEIDPANRYQSIEELMDDLLYQKSHGKQKIATMLLKRRIAKVATVVLVPIATFSFASSMLVRAAEEAAHMYVNPEFLMVSVLQSSEVQVTRVFPEIDNFLLRLFVDNGEKHIVNPNQLRWEVMASNVAQVDGNRILGLNIGETFVHGQYRMQDITMQVNVVEPMDGYVDISMRYRYGHIMQLFAGTSYRDKIDGDLGNAEFISPESMDMTNNSTIYFADSGWLRRIQAGAVETVDIGPMHLRANLVRTYHDDLYILTHIWQENDEHFYGIMRYTANGTEMLYTASAQFTSIRDLTITDELIYFIERNDGVGATYLRTIDRFNHDSVHTLMELPAGTSALAFSDGRIYMADETEGTLMLYEDEQLVHLAGIPGERAFIDGPAPLFYRPTSIRYYNGALYVWDFNVLRKVYLEEGAVREAVSLVGVASPNFSMDFELQERAERIVLPYSLLTEFVFLDNAVLLTDPRRGIIWRFE